MKRFSIKKEFEGYTTATLPKDAPPVQRQETERAFWAGASSTLFMITAIAELPEGDAEAALQSLHDQVQGFADRMKDEARRMN